MGKSKFKMALFVDDSPIDNMLHTRIIKKSGLVEHIIVKDSPLEALATLEECMLNPDNIPDVIFLDIHMPQMDGFDFLEALNQLPYFVTSHTRVIILSSSLLIEDKQRAEANKYVIGFLHKPLTLQSLYMLKDALVPPDKEANE